MRQRVYLASKFIVPSVAKEVVLVKRFVDKIKKCSHFPLTLIKAGPGYGKSTMLGFYFKNFAKNYYWFNITGEDNELFNFIYDLIYSVRISRNEFGTGILKLLDETESLRDNWNHIINMFINNLWEVYGAEKEDMYLVIEDLHRVQEQPEILEVIIYIVNNLPPGIHLVMTSRTLSTNFPWQQWKLKGKVLTLSEEDLAFGEEEIRDFFAIRKGKKLEKNVIQMIVEKTEGWAIALEMLSESFNLEKIEDLDEEMRDNSQELFDFLAFDVLDKQEKEIRDFLLNCSILNYLNESICLHLFGPTGSELMQQVIKKELFIHDYGKANYRFHSLFRDFLLHVALEENYPIRQLHTRAAKYFLDGEHYEEAINHLIKAGEFSQAVALIIKISPEHIEGARFNTLLYWLKRIPEDIYNLNPWLYVILGDIHRLTSEFHLALSLYEKAEKLKFQNIFTSEVLQRKALVYLDTVQPSRAEPLLQQALDLKESISEREKAGLLALIAENNLNSGEISEVLAIQDKAKEWGLELPVNLQARLLLRTGRLAEAVKFLEQHELVEGQTLKQSSRGQRETMLILSLLQALMGKDCYAGYALAREGIEKSQRIGSPFTECVAAARMGHSYQIRDQLDKAIQWYLRAIQIADDVRVPRGKGEPLWGLCLAYGFRGKWEQAFRYGEEGRKICLEVRDFWLAAMTSISLGVGCFMIGNYEGALSYIHEGRKLAEQCRDPFVNTIGMLWESLIYWKTQDKKKIKTSGEELLTAIKKYNYGFILTEQTIWSPRDLAIIQAMLWFYQDSQEGKYNLQVDLSPYLRGKKPAYHPGYSLFFNTLGDFKVWRGGEEIKTEDWSRDKARKLMQIIVGHRGQYVRSEQLVDWLWPDKSREQGKQNLKVIINTLNRILEPERQGNNPFFLERSTMGYGIINKDNYQVDAEIFAARVQVGLSYLKQNDLILAQEALEEAVALYTGDYLLEMSYEEWAIADQEAMRKMFMDAAEKLAQIYLQSKQWTRCIEICEEILSKDCCWENAYRLMIICYCQMKEKILAVQSFQRCKENLAKHLSVKPSQKLITLLKEGISGL